MLNGNQKGSKTAVNISSIGGSKNQQTPSNLKFSKASKAFHH